MMEDDRNTEKTAMCVIAIPVWKALISNVELMSLLQCRCVLGRNSAYDIVMFGPERLDERYYRNVWRICDCGDHGLADVVKFDDRCFESRLAYSHLLSSKEFYGAFAKYDYMLVYQLDAWVFSDALSEWCRKGYDYVGAPWCHLCRFGGDGCGKKYAGRGFVGNGGFSLRRISRFAELLPYDTFDNAAYSETLSEDSYISMIDGFIKPLCTEAAAFSVETNASWLIGNVLGGNLPFGSHGLDVYEPHLHARLTAETFVGGDILDKAFGKDSIGGNATNG